MKLSCRLCLFSLTGSQRGGTYTRKQNDRDTISMHETCQILKCKGCLSSFVFYYLKCTYVLIQWFSLSENKHKRNHNHTQNQRNTTCTLQSLPLWPDFNVQVFVPSLTGGGEEGRREREASCGSMAPRASCGSMAPGASRGSMAPGTS